MIAKGGLGMARLERIPEAMAAYLRSTPLPEFETTPYVRGRPLSERRVAIVSTAGLHRRGDLPFGPFATDYRVIPGDIASGDLLMSHLSVNFDRSGYQQDWNVVFPIDRLRELAERGTIGALADFHYSIMGAAEPSELRDSATNLADLLMRDAVDAVLLVPV
jgi:D-proline reductase (dithiol) PrdB